MKCWFSHCFFLIFSINIVNKLFDFLIICCLLLEPKRYYPDTCLVNSGKLCNNVQNTINRQIISHHSNVILLLKKCNVIKSSTILIQAIKKINFIYFDTWYSPFIDYTSTTELTLTRSYLVTTIVMTV